jgi:hypothetical protein
MKYCWIVLVALSFFCGRWSSQEKELELQTSQYEWHTGNFVLEMCEKHDIDTSGSWLLTCPKCTGGARVQSSQYSTTYYGFLTCYPEIEKLGRGEVAEIEGDWGKTYCNNCKYPEGTDWIIKQL